MELWIKKKVLIVKQFDLSCFFGGLHVRGEGEGNPDNISRFFVKEEKK